MNKYVISIFFIVFTSVSIAQNEPNKSIDGLYHLLIPEKGVKGKTNEMLIQLAENNGVIMLAVAACEKCFPAIYTYKPELSNKFGKTVFYNSSGIHVIKYDNDSFVVSLMSLNTEKDFSYLNFYSKDKSKIKTMTLEKIEVYSSKILDFY